MNSCTDESELVLAVAEAERQYRTLLVLITLAVEYEAKTITAERFAERSVATLNTYAKDRK